MQINQVITRKIVNVKLFQGKCTPPGNAKLFQMGFLGSERKEYQTGLKLAIFGTKWLQISKPKSPESIDISTDFGSWSIADSNRWPLQCECSALPTVLIHLSKIARPWVLRHPVLRCSQVRRNACVDDQLIMYFQPLLNISVSLVIVHILSVSLRQRVPQSAAIILSASVYGGWTISALALQYSLW